MSSNDHNTTSSNTVAAAAGTAAPPRNHTENEMTLLQLQLRTLRQTKQQHRNRHLPSTSSLTNNNPSDTIENNIIDQSTSSIRLSSPVGVDIPLLLHRRPHRHGTVPTSTRTTLLRTELVHLLEEALSISTEIVTTTTTTSVHTVPDEPTTMTKEQNH